MSINEDKAEFIKQLVFIAVGEDGFPDPEDREEIRGVISVLGDIYEMIEEEANDD